MKAEIGQPTFIYLEFFIQDMALGMNPNTSTMLGFVEELKLIEEHGPYPHGTYSTVRGEVWTQTISLW